MVVVISVIMGLILSTSLNTGTVSTSNLIETSSALHKVHLMLVIEAEDGVYSTKSSTAVDKYLFVYVAPSLSDSAIINCPAYEVLSVELLCR